MRKFFRSITKAAASPGATLPAGAEPRLDAILETSPHLANNPTYKQAREALDLGEEENALLLANRLLLQLESDAQRIDAAFMRFDYNGSGNLDESETRAMFAYLGFPSPDEDEVAKQLLEKIDADGSGTIEKEEFKFFVETFGGCDVLFQRSRERAATKASTVLSRDFSKRLQRDMREAGIQPESQRSWELVLPESELLEVTNLTRCQKKAVSTIRQIAMVNHTRALPKLQARVSQLGFKDMDLWTTLSWVRDFSPIIVHFFFDKMAKFFRSDTHYRSQFETGSSGGLNNTAIREKWERALFNGAYDGCKKCERPKYGVINVMNDYRGIIRAKQYGDGYMVLRGMRLRTTFSPEDSANLTAERLACLDYYAHVLHEYTDEELSETIKVATTQTLGSSSAIAAEGLKYKEAQLHGDVSFAEHVERIVLPKVSTYLDQEGKIRDICKRYGWVFTWMEDEKDRLESLEHEHRSDDRVEAWKDKLRAMCEGPSEGDTPVPEGFCIKGCGKHVAPGRTRSGNPFKTCCRGCALGFGHDVRCGVKEGHRFPCKMNCGMLAAPGLSRRGNPMDTCCRGCVKDGVHDDTCGQDPIEN